MGGTFTTCAEENVLGYPGTRYYGEHILVHEFSHSIEGSLRRVDSTLHAELQVAYEDVRQCARNATLRREHAGRVLSRRHAVVVLEQLPGSVRDERHRTFSVVARRPATI